MTHYAVQHSSSQRSFVFLSLLLVILTEASPVSAASWSNLDIGAVGAAGSSTESNGIFTSTGSGADIWGTADAFQFDYQPLTGDGTITARVVSQTDTNDWAKTGLMIRDTLTAGSQHASVFVTPAEGVVFLRRLNAAGASTTTRGPLHAAPYWVQLTRAGNTFTAFASPDGKTWTQIGQDTVLMSDEVYVGLAVTSHDAGVLSTAHIDNVTITAPIWSNIDIGAVGAKGSSSQSNGSYTVRGSGADIWGTADAFQLDYQSITGDGTVVARVLTQTNTNNWAKAGVMMRETLTAGSKQASTFITPAQGVVFQRRTGTGGASTSTTGPLHAAPYWVRLVRAGNTFTASASPDGTNWTQIGADTVQMASAIYAGLAVSSHAPGVLSTAQFDNVSVSAGCSPMTFGAVGDGKTDNTTAIQKAIDACASQGGGIVELPAGGSSSVYLTGPLTLQSHIQLQVDRGVVLQGTNDHSRYTGAYINWVYQSNEALISAKGATDVGITGAGVIDGAGGQLQPNGDPSWWTLGSNSSFRRPWLIEFYQCDHVTVSEVTLQNSPMWTQAFRFSNEIQETGVTVRAPGTSPNTDGLDLVGSSNVTLSNIDISVGDDNIAIKSGLPVDPTDPRQQGIPRMATSQVQVSNITAGGGHGISIGSETVNGINNVTIQGVRFNYTGNGIRLKTARDRGNQIYAINASDLTMNGVENPLLVNLYYPGLGGPKEPPYQAAQPITATTPYVHDITIQNLVATGAFGQSLIEGLPESCVHSITLSNVSIQTSSTGLALRHVMGTFNSVTSSAGSGPPFVIQENVDIATSGTTPALAMTPPQAGQVACASQVVPSH